MTDDERRNKFAEMDALADEARRAAKEPLTGADGVCLTAGGVPVAWRGEADLDAVLAEARGRDPTEVARVARNLQNRLRLTSEYEAARILTLGWGPMPGRELAALLHRTWRHHVWDMLKDAWTFCFGRRP